MPQMSPAARHVRARLAATSRYRPHDTECIIDLQRELRVCQAEAYLLDLLGTEPQPTGDQRERLRCLIAGMVP